MSASVAAQRYLGIFTSAAVLNILRYLCYVAALPILFVAAELFLLPVDFFGFRSWESIAAQDPGAYGPFYPNINVVKSSAGDYDPYGERTRLIDFITDKYGFRNADSDGHFDIVVTGDSHVGGAHLKQEETLSLVLAKMCDCRVYNYGAIGFARFQRLLIDGRFKGDNRPKYMIVELRPYADFMAADPTIYSPVETSDEQIFFTPMTGYEVLVDRIKKMAGFNFLYARLFDLVHVDKAAHKAVAAQGERERRRRAGRAADGNAYPYVLSPATDLGYKYDYERGLRVVNSIEVAIKANGIIPIFLIMPWFDRQIDPIIAELAKTKKIVYFGPGTGLPTDPSDNVNYTFREDRHWRPSAVRAAAERLADCLDAATTCQRMPQIRLVQDDDDGGCMYDDRSFTRGARVCAARRILMTCQVPPKEQQDELGSELQWTTVTSEACER